MARMYITISDDLLEDFDRACAEHGMTRTNMFLLIFKSYIDELPMSLRDKQLIEILSEVNVTTKEVLISESLDYEKRMFLTESVKKITSLIKNSKR